MRLTMSVRYFLACASTNKNSNKEYGNQSQLRARAGNQTEHHQGNNASPLEKSIQSHFQEALLQARSKDLRGAVTSIGPHRDDLKLKINDPPVELTASRGELRSTLMELKKAEIAWITTKTQDTPIILLDDIFSELDATRKNNLFALLHDTLPHSTQIIMTIASGNPLPSSLTTHPRLRSASTVRKIHQGMITPL